MTVSEGAPVAEASEVARGQRIGRYVVLGRLGAGGMGVVFSAYDPELDRKVAVKVLHSDATAGKLARGRLLREAQAMAQLSHPNVVTVHDVGTHAGQVFIAMEFVDGVTLQGWLAAEPRSRSQILDVFRRAGEGLVAAHDEGLVHRDFKPDNVMVRTDGRVKVMDFGLARRTAEPSSPEPGESDDDVIPSHTPLSTELTAAGRVVGTPAYMAPEQHLGLAVDARSDQFSYCVALWEALCSKRPFAGRSLAELVMAVTGGERTEAPGRAELPVWLRRILDRGLAVDPQQRFASMADLLRALGRDPTRRRRVALLGVGVVAVAGAALGWQRLDLARRRDACEVAAREIRLSFNDAIAADIEAAIKTTGVGYAQTAYTKTLPWLDDYRTRWAEARASSCLAATVDGTLPMGTYERAVECFDARRVALDELVEILRTADADAVRRAVQAAASLPRLQPCSDERWLSRRASRPASEHEAAEALRDEMARVAALTHAARYDEAAEAVEALQTRAEAVDEPAVLARVAELASVVHGERGDYAAAETLAVEAVMVAGAAGADEVAADAAARLTDVVGYRLGRDAEGLTWGRSAQMWLARLGLEDPLRQARVHTSIGNVHYGAGRYREALAAYEWGLQLRRDELGENHPEVASSLNNIANTYQSLGDYDAAVTTHERALAIKRQTWGEDHPTIASTLHNLGNTYRNRGDVEAALVALSDAKRIWEQALGPDHPQVATALGVLGIARAIHDEPRRAQALFARALKVREAALGPEHPLVASTLNNLANCEWKNGEREAASAHHRQALEIREKALRPDHPAIATSLMNVGAVESADAAVALEYYLRALEIRTQALGPEHPKTLDSLHHVVDAELSLSRWADAIAHLEPALARAEASGDDEAAKALRTRLDRAHRRDE